MEIGQQGYRWVLDADIAGFLRQLVTQGAVMRELSDVVADGNILGNWWRSSSGPGVMEGGKDTTDASRYTPQGGVASPLLANIALNVLDWHLHESTDSALCGTPTTLWCSARARTKPKRL